MSDRGNGGPHRTREGQGAFGLFLPLLVCWGVGVVAVFFLYEWLNALTRGQATAREHLMGLAAALVLAGIVWVAARVLQRHEI